ncbi:hypothetical protein A5662_00455 [Mycobacteriaceae bacterium 1482268.1]|nr:hypothetical protein A5662_00455 [Mycobacteriaceae bacterium 1482268.1]
MATAAAALAMSVGAGTAQAKPGDTLNKILHPNKTDSASASDTSAPKTKVGATSGSPNIGSFLSSIAPSIYNPGPFTFGPVTDPKFPTGVIVKDPVPGSKPFPQITGIQLPFWTVNNGTPVPPA